MWVESKALWVGGNEGGWRTLRGPRKRFSLPPFRAQYCSVSSYQKANATVCSNTGEQLLFFFFLLCNLFLFRSALICAVAADDKTGHIRLLSELCRGSSHTVVCFKNFAVQNSRNKKVKNFFQVNFFLASFCNSLEVFC